MQTYSQSVNKCRSKRHNLVDAQRISQPLTINLIGKAQGLRLIRRYLDKNPENW